MPIEGFDYKALSIKLSEDALEKLMQLDKNTLPNPLTDAEKKEIVETVKRFSFLGGQALNHDDILKLNSEQAIFLISLLCEWIYSKFVDMIRDQVPEKKRKSILVNIAANIFNTSKLAIIKNIPYDDIINLVEEEVKRVYAEELKKLESNSSNLIWWLFIFLLLIFVSYFMFFHKKFNLPDFIEKRTILIQEFIGNKKQFNLAEKSELSTSKDEVIEEKVSSVSEETLDGQNGQEKVKLE